MQKSTESEDVEDVTQKVQAALQSLFPQPQQLVAHVEVGVQLLHETTKLQVWCFLERHAYSFGAPRVKLRGLTKSCGKTLHV